MQQSTVIMATIEDKKKSKNRMCEDCKIKQAVYGFEKDMKARWCTRCGKDKHPGTVNVKHKQCEDCGQKSASWGPIDENIARWCGTCAKKDHKEAILFTKRCETCKILIPTYGMQKGKPQWCKECSKSHPGAFDVKHDMCEICHETRPCFGYEDEKKLRWCLICSQTITHEKPVINLIQRNCEDCKIVSAMYGSNNTKRWCAKCAKNHPGAIDVKSTFCENCEIIRPSYGLENDKRHRWCCNCAKLFTNAIRVSGNFCKVCNVVQASFGVQGEGCKWCFKCKPDDEKVQNLLTKRCANPDCVMKATVAYDKTHCSQCDPNQDTKLRSKEKRIFKILSEAFPDQVFVGNRSINGDKECPGRLKRPDIIVHKPAFGMSDLKNGYSKFFLRLFQTKFLWEIDR